MGPGSGCDGRTALVRKRLAAVFVPPTSGWRLNCSHGLLRWSTKPEEIAVVYKLNVSHYGEIASCLQCVGLKWERRRCVLAEKIKCQRKPSICRAVKVTNTHHTHTHTLYKSGFQYKNVRLRISAFSAHLLYCAFKEQTTTDTMYRKNLYTHLTHN